MSGLGTTFGDCAFSFRRHGGELLVDSQPVRLAGGAAFHEGEITIGFHADEIRRV